jgi:hypothetical protein
VFEAVLIVFVSSLRAAEKAAALSLAIATCLAGEFGPSYSEMKLYLFLL